MRNDDREFERIVRDGWGASGSSLPGAERYWPWAACPVAMAPVAGAALYPIAVPAHAFMLEGLAGAYKGFVRALAFLVSGEPGVVDGCAPGWSSTLVRPPLQAREELAAAFCVVSGAKLAGFVGDSMPAWTAACRGYAAGLSPTKLLARFVRRSPAAIVVGAA